MKIPKDKKIIIIEGIAGSGKTTIVENLKKKFKNSSIYEFSENDLLFSWKHLWIKNLQSVRLNYMNKLLNFCKETLGKNEKTIFIFDRFHITYYLFSIMNKEKIPSDYNKIITQLRKLPVYIILPVLDRSLIEERTRHIERKDKLWNFHREKRLKKLGFNNFTDLYIWEQNKVLNLIKKQKIPYSIIELKI